MILRALLLVLMLAASQAHAQISSGLVSYWKSDEASGNLVDVHGANTLTETSGTIDATSGKINGARDYVAADSEWFEKADNSDLSTGDIDFSFGLWFQRQSIVSYPRILSKYAGSSGSDEYEIYVNSDDGKPTFAVRNSSGTQTEVKWGSLIAVDTWYYLACGHSAASDQIWISINAGTPVTAAHTGGVRDGTQPFQIGACTAYPVYWDGLIDEVGFWKRDIRSDVASLYASGSGLAYPFGASSSAVAKILLQLSDARLRRQSKHFATYGVYSLSP